MTRSPKTEVRYAVVGLGHIAQGAVLPAFKPPETRNSLRWSRETERSRNKLHSAQQRAGTSGLEGLEDIRIVEAIYHSIRTRRTVAIPALKIEERPSQAQEIRRPAHGKPEADRAHSASREAA